VKRYRAKRADPEFDEPLFGVGGRLGE